MCWLFIALGLLVVTVVDVDGDPTTSNVTSIVLTGATDTDTDGHVVGSHSRKSGPVHRWRDHRPRFVELIVHWVGTWWRPRGHPIRGP